MTTKQNKSARYQMWMTYDNSQQRIHFPLLPESISVEYGSTVKSVNIIGLGEIFLKDDRPAVTVSYDVVLPAFDFPGQKVKKLQKPEMLKKRILRWKGYDKPVHFFITETGINLFALIVDLSYEEKGGDKGALYLSMKLKEYREPKVRQVLVDEAGNVTLPPQLVEIPDNTEIPATYKVVKGDTLKLIAKRFLGDSSKYKEIMKLNPKIKNAALIDVGMVLKMPVKRLMEIK